MPDDNAPDAERERWEKELAVLQKQMAKRGDARDARAHRGNPESDGSATMNPYAPPKGDVEPPPEPPKPPERSSHILPVAALVCLSIGAYRAATVGEAELGGLALIYTGIIAASVAWVASGKRKS